MDAIVKKMPAQPADVAPEEESACPSREEAEEAVRTLIRWAGDTPVITVNKIACVPVMQVRVGF